MEGHGLSQRRACRLVGIGHATLPYQRRRANDDAVRKRLRELAAQRRRFGYRRLGWLLAREGHAMNHKKLYRLYREERLMVEWRGGRKRALGSRTPMMVPAGAINASPVLYYLTSQFRLRSLDRYPVYGLSANV